MTAAANPTYAITPPGTPLPVMSLRDWFAGQFLAGMAAHPDSMDRADTEVAAAAYQHADAMLAARECKP